VLICITVTVSHMHNYINSRLR